MGDIRSCEKLLLEARVCVVEALEASKRENPLIDATGIANRLISLIRMIDAVVRSPKGDGTGARVS
jgi:hypothetical protein